MMHRPFVGRLLRLMVWAAGSLCATVLADTLDNIQRRGELVVGVKRDVPLWGQLDVASGRIVGLEPDLAGDLAARLGVRLRLVGLLSAERQEALEQRRVDLLLATLSDTPERRKRMAMVLPHYYASGVNILARRQWSFREWGDLRNRRVCGRRGAYYNRAMTVNAGMDLVPLYDNARALAALRDGRCDAVLYDDTNIIAMLQESHWSNEFEMPLKTELVVPWAIGVHLEDTGSRLAQAVSQAVIDWHRTGRIVELERKWGIPASDYAQRKMASWRRRSPGGFVCGVAVGPATPEECL
ncbi:MULTISPECIES: transporter substrate-binding domain-containing protein [unclassified Ramlibacter]|uniref:transporter substrate-binding domain-containing protein n=1 Tax=unclassified Ramlibacter TaxID=2617605 RepID=UPI00366E2DEB